MQRVTSRMTYGLVPPLYLAISRLLFGTCRLKEIGSEHLRQCEAGAPLIIAFWHYSIYYIIHQASRISSGSPWVAMVSASSDGEYVSRVLAMMGGVTVRGSRGSGKGGSAALREMIRRIEQGRWAAIVADGSQGPAFVAQPGAVLLAARTGAPILPIVWAADRYWVIGSWDRSVVPKPFARISLAYGELFRVPTGISGAEVEKYRAELERRLNTQYEDVWSRFGRQGH